MNDADLRAVQARIDALHEKWAPHIGLGWWKIVYRWYRGPIPKHEAGIPVAGEDGVLMSCEVLPRYHRAVICVNAPAAFDESDTHLEEAFVHELMHVFLGPLWAARDYADDDARRDVEESVATALGHGFQWLREHCEQRKEERSGPDQDRGQAVHRGTLDGACSTPIMVGAEHDGRP